MWWFISGILALTVVVAIVLNRRGSTAAYDSSSEHRPDTSMDGYSPTDLLDLLELLTDGLRVAALERPHAQPRGLGVRAGTARARALVLAAPRRRASGDQRQPLG